MCQPFQTEDDDRLVADVVCRQLGYPHGTPVQPLVNEADGPVIDYEDYEYTYVRRDPVPEEAEEPQGRFWLSRAACRGTEDDLLDCDLGPGFRRGNAGCADSPVRMTVACRSFPVPAALESVVTPGARANLLPWKLQRANVLHPSFPCQTADQALRHPKNYEHCCAMGEAFI